MNLNGIYLGVVEKVSDPEHLGRVKVRVPAAFGVTGSSAGSIPVDDLPWALPMGLPAGGSNASGGFSMLPVVGDQVAVQFIDGEPEKPVWQWLMQTQNQAKALKLHQYREKTENSTTVSGDPSRAILTRYGHTLELAPNSVTLSTSEGYQALLSASTSETGGAAALQTPKGQRVTLNDNAGTAVVQALETAVVSAKKVILNAATSVLVKTTRFSLMAGTTLIAVQGNGIAVTTASGASVLIDESGNIALCSAGGAAISVENEKIQIGEPAGASVVIDAGKVSVNAPQMVINTAAMSVGTSAGYPVMMMTPAMLIWLMAHTHTNGNEGSPTGPPIPMDPTFATGATSTRLQTS